MIKTAPKSFPLTQENVLHFVHLINKPITDPKTVKMMEELDKKLKKFNQLGVAF